MQHHSAQKSYNENKNLKCWCGCKQLKIPLTADLQPLWKTAQQYLLTLNTHVSVYMPNTVGA